MPRKTVPVMGVMGPTMLQTSDAIDDATFKGVSTKFPVYVNGYFEELPDKEDHRKFAFAKRFGLDVTGAPSISATYNGYKIQGVITSLDKTKLLFYMNNAASNRTAYYDGTTLTVSAGAAPAAAGNWTISGPVVWTVLDGISYGANVYYAVTDFTKGAVVNSTGTWTEITDADFTGLTKVTNFVGLDGYLFIGTSNNRIYNSDLNTATAWTATSFLTAADVPGNLLWLGRIKNYLIAFKQYSIEFFEDTGNPTPGSPLTPVKQLRKSIGLVCSSSVQYVSDGIIFLGMSEKMRIGIYKLKYDNLELELVSDYYMNQVLGHSNIYTTSSSYSVDSTMAGTALGQSQVCTWAGKEFYIINLSGQSVGTKRTMVYDNLLKTWVHWTTWFSSSGAATTGLFDVSQCVQFTITAANLTMNLFVNNFRSVGSGLAPIFNSAAYGAQIGATDTDGTNTVNFPFVWMGDIVDFGTRQRKFCDSLEFLIDQETSAQLTLTMYYRDYNFTTTAGQAITRTLTTNTVAKTGRARFTRLGQFRKRQFGVMENSSNYWKISGVEVVFNIGEQDQDS
jgi:hypothetical protein